METLNETCECATPSQDLNPGLAEEPQLDTDTFEDSYQDSELNAELFSIQNACQFNILDVHRNGFGPYHINNHIGFFHAPAGFNLSNAVQQLANNFPQVFRTNNIATARFMGCQYNNLPTVKFTLDAPGPDLHDDWVFITQGAQNFFATTLERRWYEPWERVTGVGLIPTGMIPTLFGRIAIDVNRRHFLAGKRSWTVGQLPGTNLHFIETAAYERYSHALYHAAEGPLGMRAKILETWTKFIENYANFIGAQLVSHVPPGFLVNRQIAYRETSHTNGNTIRSSGWFPQVSQRHPNI